MMRTEELFNPQLLLVLLRERYHPLFHLRKFKAYQWLTRRFDIPVPIWFDGISHKVYVSLSKNLTFVLSAGKAGEAEERKNFTEILERGGFKNFCDIGANIGMYGFLFRTLVRDGTVMMIEADPANARLLRRTICQDPRGITLIEAAASDREGIATFYLDGLSSATGSLRRGGQESSFLARNHGVRPTASSVSCITLDGLYSDKEHPDFIKMDVEGAELQVLRGAASILSRSAPAIFFESEEDHEEKQILLSAHGYVFYDFRSLKPIDRLVRNSLALHPQRHASLVRTFGL